MNEDNKETAEEQSAPEQTKSMDQIEEELIDEESAEEPEAADEESADDGAGEDAEETEEEEAEEEVKQEEPPAKDPEVDKSLLDYKDQAEYVYDKLPTIKVMGQESDGSELKEFEIKSGAELPDGFVPRSYKDAQILSEQLADQRMAAQKLAGEYDNGVIDVRNTEYKEQIEAAWNTEIEAATKEGELPAIKAKEGDKDYWEDEGVKAVANVIEFMANENERLAKINAPYRVQSFTQAKQLYDISEAKQKEVADNKQDAQVRKQRGSMVSSSSSNSAPKQQTSQYYTRGDDLEDVATKALDDLLS